MFIKEDSILSADEAAEFMGVRKSTVYQLNMKGMLPSHKIGGKIIFLQSELYDWIKQDKASNDYKVKK